MDLKLQVLLQALDKASAPLRKVQGSATGAAAQLKKTREALRQLDQTQKAVGDFRKLKQGTLDTSKRMTDLQARTRAVAQQMKATATPSAALTKEFGKLTREGTKLKATQTAQQAKLQGLRNTLREAGINTHQLSTAEAGLRTKSASTTRAIQQQTTALRAQGIQAQRTARMHDRLRKSEALGAHLSVAGYAGFEGGRRILHGIHPMLDEGKLYQTNIAQLRAQGTSNADVAAAEHFANTDTTRGSSINDKLEIVKDANSIFRDMHEALQVAPSLLKAKYTFEALMSSHGEGAGGGAETVNQLIDAIRTGELRNATKTPADFTHMLDMMARAYVGSGGLVKPSDYLHTMKVGGVATKQMDEKALFFGAMHTIQEMGGMRAGTGFASAYQNWAAGRSTQQTAEALDQLGLVNKGAVKYGKTGHITKMLPGALVNQSLYETNPFEYLMKEVVPRINPKGKLSENEVVSKINGLFSARKGGDLFAGMYMQRGNIRKQMRAAEHFASLNSTYSQTGNTAQGEETDLEAKKRDLYLELGRQLLPVYVKALQKLVAVLRTVTAFAQRHPVLGKALTVIGAGLGLLMVSIGGVMIALGGLIGQFALLRFAFARAGLGSFLKGLFGGVRLVGQAFLWLGRIMLANPVLLIITAIALAAYLIYRNWDKIKPYWDRLWSSIKRVTAAVWDWIVNAVGVTVETFKAAWQGLKGFFVTLWEALKAPFIAGFAWISDKLDAAEARWNKIKDALSVGGVGTALAVATDSRQSAGTRAKAGLFAALPLLMAGISPGVAAAGLISSNKPVMDTSAPLRAGGSVVHQTTHVGGITVVQQPGEDGPALAKRIDDRISAHGRAKAAAHRSRLGDTE